jgi:hypothetical protein
MWVAWVGRQRHGANAFRDSVMAIGGCLQSPFPTLPRPSSLTASPLLSTPRCPTLLPRPALQNDGGDKPISDQWLDPFVIVGEDDKPVGAIQDGEAQLGGSGYWVSDNSKGVWGRATTRWAQSRTIRWWPPGTCLSAGPPAEPPNSPHLPLSRVHRCRCRRRRHRTHPPTNLLPAACLPHSQPVQATRWPSSTSVLTA